MTGEQLVVLLIGSIVTGLAFGLSFGIVEASAIQEHDVIFILTVMQFVAVPVGAVVGAVTAVLIYYLRSSSYNYQLQLNADSGIEIESDLEGPDSL